jgi:hypothetical protein
MDLFRTLRKGESRTDTGGVGPFDASHSNFEHPSVRDAVRRDILYDKHKKFSKEPNSAYIIPEPGGTRDSDMMAFFSTTPVVDAAPRADETVVAPELIELLRIG